MGYCYDKLGAHFACNKVNNTFPVKTLDNLKTPVFPVLPIILPMTRGNKPLLNIPGNTCVEIDEVINTSVNLDLASNMLAPLHHTTTHRQPGSQRDALDV